MSGDVMQRFAAEETLDPENWSEVRSLSYQMIDDAITYLQFIRDRPVWQDMPPPVKASFVTPLPNEPTKLAEVYQEIAENLMPYAMGNVHPRFWMWYMGASNFTGALGDFLAAIQGSNLGGGNHAAACMDQQVVNWCKQMMGFPNEASGTLVSGGSVANLIGLTVARNVTSQIDVRAEGIAAAPKPLRFYASDQAHSCHQKAVELLGLGRKSLRIVPSRPDFQMDIGALERMIAEDRLAGWHPSCVIATAGTVNTGAIDDLVAVRNLCGREGLWFHVDGCIGAFIAIAPQNRDLVAGISMADSLALDPHKWLHTPFEAGCALIKNATDHLNTFALHPEYLEVKQRGIAAAQYLFDYGLQTTRGFRALKIWMALKEHGLAKFGRLVDQNISQAHYLTGLIEQDERLELLAPTNINIVCFRFNPGNRSEQELRSINTEIMLRLQETGLAAVSDTTLLDKHCLRVAIVNHRTRRSDLALLVREIVRVGEALS
jgi:glutamate/tyrosine decarboxylase-like PLP-dependent enzyme